jgi:hypothetical protein
VQSKLLLSAGVIAFLAAVWHLLCIWGGPSWFAFARAPQQIVESARDGTLLAPIGTIIVAGLMFLCSAFAFSAVGLMRHIPLIKPALITIAFLSTLRGIIAIPTFYNHVGIDTWQIIASTVWFYVGICFFIGSFEHHKVIKASS